MTTSDDGYERALSDLNAHAERLEAENVRLRDKVATYIEDARYYHRQWKRQSELNLDAIQEIARLRDNLRSAIVGVLADLREADRLRYGFDWPGLLPIAQKIIERAELEGVRNDRK